MFELSGHTQEEDPVPDCDCRRCAIAERDRLRTLARDAHTAWDNDRDARVGKLLMAMLDCEFSKTYRPDLTHNAELCGGEAVRTNDGLGADLKGEQ